MAQLPENRALTNTAPEHVDDHNELHRLHNELDGHVTMYGPLRLTVNAQTGTTYTIVLSDEQKLVTLSNTSPVTVTLPQDSDVAIPVGGQVHFAVINTGMVTWIAGSGATVNSTPTAQSRAQYSMVTAVKRAANTWLLVGDLAS